MMPVSLSERRAGAAWFCSLCPSQQSKEAHEAAAEENQNGHTEPESGRPVRALRRCHQHPLLLLQWDAQDPGKHLRHVCLTGGVVLLELHRCFILFIQIKYQIWHYGAFRVCFIQDFEAVTPNLLARTIETVEGGGIVVILLRTMNSLKQLYTMTMVSLSASSAVVTPPLLVPAASQWFVLHQDVHARYRTEAHQDVVGRFNER